MPLLIGLYVVLGLAYVGIGFVDLACRLIGITTAPAVSGLGFVALGMSTFAFTIAWGLRRRWRLVQFALLVMCWWCIAVCTIVSVIALAKTIGWTDGHAFGVREAPGETLLIASGMSAFALFHLWVLRSRPEPSIVPATSIDQPKEIVGRARGRRRMWAAGMIGMLVLGALGLYALDPMHIPTGLAHGEKFFKGRPTAYWREILRADGEAGAISDSTRATFRSHLAIPVLAECVKDADRNVRWPAVNLLGRFGGPIISFTNRLLPSLQTALNDDDAEVRLQAVFAAIDLGANARPLAPDLERLLGDVEAQVADAADVALWEVAPASAVKACRWQSYRSGRWRFVATFPPRLEETTAKKREIGHEFTEHRVAAQHSRTHCVVAVIEPSPDTFAALTDDGFAALASKLIRQSLDGNVLAEREVEAKGVSGHEYEIELPEGTEIRLRTFVTGRRYYLVQATFTRALPYGGAVRWFLESFEPLP